MNCCRYYVVSPQKKFLIAIKEKLNGDIVLAFGNIFIAKGYGEV